MGFRKNGKIKYGNGVIDVVDTVDNSLMDYEAAWIKFRRGTLVLMSKGESVPIMIRKILNAAKSEPIKKLRFHGHGFPGCQGIAMGQTKSSNPYVAISVQSLGLISPMLKLLTDKFSDSSTVDLLGCNVAEGNEGSKLLNNLAKLWQVPVKGGVEIQGATSPKNSLSKASEKIALTHEGQTITAYP